MRSKEKAKNKDFAFDFLIGKSLPMQKVFERLEKIVERDVTVLIEGESGTGKELVARAIHYRSPRRQNEFVVINCSAFSDYLLESELFGHEKGSFTGAIAEKKGLFEVADHGTFFMDEIADMSPALQVKLLRVLQEQTFFRVGGTKPIKVDVRIVAATNKPLKKLIESGQFREDLYYRLNVVNITLPPLRERKDDILILADHILADVAKKSGEPKKRLSKPASELLRRHTWPGNVRELENEIERAVIFSKGQTIDAGNFSHGALANAQASVSLPRLGKGKTLRSIKRAVVEKVEKEAILSGLAQTGWNKSACARLLGISRVDLMRKLARYKLKRPGKSRDKV